MLSRRQNRHNSSICSSRACRALVTVLLLVLVFAMSSVGSYLNRGRGGAIETSGSYWQRHISSRVLFAVPTAIIMGLCGLNMKAFLLVALHTWFSLYVGWGCYFPGSDYKSRSGVFDWLVGRAQKEWSAERNFFRYFSGMSLRGLVWTAPSGYALYHMGYGWQFALSGALMGSVYSIGWNLPSTDDITKGIPWAECVWGYWIWIVMVVSALAGLFEKLQKHSQHRRQPLSPWLSSYLLQRVCAVAFEVWHLVLSLIFVGSTIFYALVQQKDIRNKGQTFFGMFTSSVLLLIMQIVVLTASWLSAKKGVDVTNDMFGVAVLTDNVTPYRNHTMCDFNKSTQQNSRRGSQPYTEYRPSTPYQCTGQNQLLSDDQPSLGSRDLFEPRMLSSMRKKTVQDSQSPDDSSDDDSFDFPLSILKDHFRQVLWHYVDALVYWRVFAAVRMFFGVISLLACVATVYATLTDVVWNLQEPRFLDVCTCAQ